MRLVVKKYDNGDTYLVETDNDGASVIDEDGKRQPGERISATVEVLADDDETGIERLLEAMQAIRARIQQRKHGPGGNARKGARKPSR